MAIFTINAVLRNAMLSGILPPPSVRQDAGRTMGQNYLIKRTNESNLIKFVTEPKEILFLVKLYDTIKKFDLIEELTRGSLSAFRIQAGRQNRMSRLQTFG